jgi:hypothetical protein
VTKTPKKPPAPKMGRPRKNGHGRKGVFVYLPVDLLAELDAYVRTLRAKAPGASRGDVVAAALRSFRPFRKSTPARKGKG